MALARGIGRDGGAVRHLEFGVGGCGGGGTAARYFWAARADEGVRPYTSCGAAWADGGVRPYIFCGRGVVGDFFYYVKGIVEPGAVGVFYCDVESADDQLGALGIDGVADERVDDFHQRGLNGLFALELSDGMKTRARRSANAANHALVEVAELLSAESRRVATDSSDFDMSAGARVGQ